MKSGFGGLVFWVVVLLVTVSVAWGQGPAAQPQMTPMQALEVIGSINPHFEGSIEQINEQRELQFQAFQVLRALVVEKVQAEAKTKESKKAEEKPSVEDNQTKKGAVDASTDTKAEAAPVANEPVKAEAEATTDTAPAAPSPTQGEAAAPSPRKKRGK